MQGIKMSSLVLFINTQGDTPKTSKQETTAPTALIMRVSCRTYHLTGNSLYDRCTILILQSIARERTNSALLQATNSTLLQA